MAAVQNPSNPAPHVVVQGQPGALPGQIVAQQPATVMVQNPNTSEAYSAKCAKVTGWMQLCCAVACFVIGIIQVHVGSPLGSFGTGIWSGWLIMLPTGILGIVSQKKNTCVIVAYMVMSIISALDAVVVFTMGFILAMSNEDPHSSYHSSYRDPEILVRIAFDSLLTITGFIELIVAIVAACYCCAGVCCGRTTSSANTIVYHQQSNVTPMVMMVPAYGQPISGQQQPAPVSQRQGHYPAPVGYPQGGNTGTSAK